jgi:hypothetical protein
MSSAPATSPLVLDPTFLVVNAVKDDGSNTRSDITALDRNLSGVANANTTAIMQAAERSNLHNNMVEDARFRENRENTNRANDFLMNDGRRNFDSLTNSVERNGTANQVSTQATSAATQIAVEKNSASLSQAIDRNGAMNEVATERNGGTVRDLIHGLSHDQRQTDIRNHTDVLNGFTNSLLASKDTDIRILEGLKATEGMINATNYNVLRSQKDLETIAARNAADTARDAANAVRDALTNRAEIMRQAADNTAAIQIEALKNKDHLANKMDHQYSDLKQRIADASLLQRDIDGARLRDNANDYRIENAILRERHHHHHGYDGRDGHRHSDGHIHNNLYSGHNGYPFHHQHQHDRRFFGGEGGFGNQGFGGQGFGPNGIQSQSNSN